MFVIYLFFASLTNPLYGQVTQEWARRYNTSRISPYDTAKAMTVDAQGNVYVTGQSSNKDNISLDLLTIKYDVQGKQVWQQGYNSGFNPYNNINLPDYARDIAVDKNGNVYVTGYSALSIDGSQSQLVTIKYNPQGQSLWIRTYIYSTRNEAKAIKVDENGYIYVSGYSPDANASITVKYDPEGNIIWRKNYNLYLTKLIQLNDALIDAQGNHYFTGHNGKTPKADFVIVAYDLEGKLLWEHSYTYNNVSNDIATALTADTQGNIYVTGYSSKVAAPNFDYDYLTVKYNKNGNHLWVKRFTTDTPVNDISTAIASDNQGNIYVSGKSEGTYPVVKYDSTGNRLSVNYLNNAPSSALYIDSLNNVYLTGESFITSRYTSSFTQIWTNAYTTTVNGEEYASAMATDAQGNVYITGYSTIGNSLRNGDRLYDIVTIKYNALGQRVWIRTYDGPAKGNDYPVSIAVDAQGNVIVAGNSFEGDSVFIYPNSTTYAYDFVTIKYSPDGTQLWANRYASPENPGDRPYESDDTVKDLAVDKQGNIYVMGRSGIESSKTYYSTIKYSPQGNQLWQKIHSIPTAAITLDETGNLYVTGRPSTEFGWQFPMQIVKYDTNGKQIFERAFNALDLAADIVTDSQNNIYVTGSLTTIDYYGDYHTYFATAKFDNTGNQLWARYSFYANSDPTITARAITVDQLGNVYITGEATVGDYPNPRSQEYKTIKYDAKGNELWAKTYNASKTKVEIGKAITVDAQGGVYVSGNSGVIKYDQAGNLVWSKTSPEDVVTLIVNERMDVFIAGTDITTNTFADYLLVKYNQITELPCTASGSISQELWLNVAGSSVSDIPVNTAPTSVSQLTSFESKTNQGTSYGERIRGYLCVPASGNYTFYLAGDDKCELWLSSDDDPAKKVKIASVSYYTGVREWTKYASQKSVAIALQTGKKYYIEALHKEDKYSDNLAVGWTKPSGSTIEVIPGSALSSYIPQGAGKISREYWANIAGSLVSDIPLTSAPTSVTEITSFETSTNTANNYGQRIRGFVHPQVSGYYRFFIAGDDRCELWLSSDDDPANKTKVASVPYFTAVRQWNKYSTQQSVLIYLVAGRKYYTEALHKEDKYSDNLAIGWQTPVDSSISVITGLYLSPFLPAPAIARMGVEESVANQASLYPNPFDDKLTLNTSYPGKLKISLTDNVGRVVYHTTVEDNRIEISLEVSHLKAGVYIVTLSWEDKPAQVFRIVKR